MKSRKEGSGSEKRFCLLTADDLEALPDPEWLIDGVLPSRGLSVLYGNRSAGKSFLALDWTFRIATGRAWSRHNVQKGDVVYIYAEGAAGLKARAQAWRKGREEKVDRVYFLPHPVNVLDRNGEVARLIDAIRAQPSAPSLIVIDTLARCFGSGDENAAKDMNAFVAGTDAIREAFPGTTVLVVHHQGKDGRRGERGHSALGAAADTIMRLTNKHGAITLTCEKQKDAEPFKQIALRLRTVDLGGGMSSGVLDMASAAKRLASTDVVTSDPRAIETDHRALDALTQFPNGATFTEWKSAAGVAKSTMQKVRDRLLAAGGIVQEGKRYRVADAGPRADTGPIQGFQEAA